ncbi:MAG: WhiB family transcriptional regulator [Actinomycetota bacterium]|nr:WhiB family transcriptional regulator [Actinomycetota bacterium]
MTPLSVAPPPGRASWRLNGACVDLDPEIFFPAGTAAQVARQARTAKRACRSCSVTSPCLEAAAATQQREGIWGGLDAGERSRLDAPGSPAGSVGLIA